jgi:hypothetical protein
MPVAAAPRVKRTDGPLAAAQGPKAASAAPRATLNSRTQKQKLWEVFSTGFVFAADSANHVAFRCTFQGWWCDEEKEMLLADLRTEIDIKKRKAIVDRIQTVFYDDVAA